MECSRTKRSSCGYRTLQKHTAFLVGWSCPTRPGVVSLGASFVPAVPAAWSGWVLLEEGSVQWGRGAPRCWMLLEHLSSFSPRFCKWLPVLIRTAVDNFWWFSEQMSAWGGKNLQSSLQTENLLCPQKFRTKIVNLPSRYISTCDVLANNCEQSLANPQLWKRGHPTVRGF